MEDVRARTRRTARCSACPTTRPRPSGSSPRDAAYPCYCTPDELDADRKAQEAAKQPARYVGSMREPDGRGARRPRGRGTPAARSRFRVREGVIGWDDLIRDRIEIDTANLGGDFVIVRADGTPLYHFTVVVDDAAMAISHVIRGEDHVSNTPKHILLLRGAGLRAADVRPPAAHPQRRRHQDEQAQEPDGRRRLHRPGLHPGGPRQLLRVPRLVAGDGGGAVLAVDELEQRFDIEKVQKGGARFDRERLEWLNGQWIRRLERRRPGRAAAAVPRGGRGQRRHRPDADRRTRSARSCRWSASGCRRSPRSSTSSASCGVDELDVDPALLVPKRWDVATTAEGLARRPRAARCPRRGDLGGRGAGAAAARARRGARLEGRRPVHGDPGRRRRA